MWQRWVAWSSLCNRSYTGKAEGLVGGTPSACSLEKSLRTNKMEGNGLVVAQGKQRCLIAQEQSLSAPGRSKGRGRGSVTWKQWEIPGSGVWVMMDEPGRSGFLAESGKQRQETHGTYFL